MSGADPREPETSTPGASVRQRRVIYIPGYDPVPPRKYRERYRREAAKQAELSGHHLTMKQARPGVRFGWRVAARVEGEEVSAAVEVAYWADLVRASMRSGILATYGALLRTAWIYLSTGALFRLMRLRKGPMIAALYPVAVLLAQLLISVGFGAIVGWLAYALSDQVLHWIEGPVFPTQSGWPLRAGLAAFVIAPVAAWAVLRVFQRRDPFYAWYLIHDYAYSARDRGAYPAEQEARMAELGARIAQALADPATDEVLVVGHSSGAYMAVSILADLLRADRVAEDGPALSLLTLGQVIPMVSFLPRADRLRADLATLSVSDRIAWVDVSAPGDGCAFALCDPVAVTGVAPEGQRWPLVLSAAYQKTLKPRTAAALRWNLFEAHFQYLNAFDNLPGEIGVFDYFAVTAGPRTLLERFGHRAPSPSRITRPLSRYRSCAE